MRRLTTDEGRRDEELCLSENKQIFRVSAGPGSDPVISLSDFNLTVGQHHAPSFNDAV